VADQSVRQLSGFTVALPWPSGVIDANPYKRDLLGALGDSQDPLGILPTKLVPVWRPPAPRQAWIGTLFVGWWATSVDVARLLLFAFAAAATGLAAALIAFGGFRIVGRLYRRARGSPNAVAAEASTELAIRPSYSSVVDPGRPPPTHTIL
jgi:hypothetical protein